MKPVLGADQDTVASPPGLAICSSPSSLDGRRWEEREAGRKDRMSESDEGPTPSLQAAGRTPSPLLPC